MILKKLFVPVVLIQQNSVAIPMLNPFNRPTSILKFSQTNNEERISYSFTKSESDILQFIPQVSDTFSPHDFDDDNSEPLVIYANILNDHMSCESDDKSHSESPFHNWVRNVVSDCPMVCPSQLYTSTIRQRDSDGPSSPILFTSLRSKFKQKSRLNVPHPPTLQKPEPSSAGDEKSLEENIIEPSMAILKGVTQPLIPVSIWNSLTGREFYFPSTITALVKSAIRTVLDDQSQHFIEWKPANSITKQLFQDNNQGYDRESVKKALLEEDQILVWTGRFKDNGYGSDLPLIKTKSIIPMSPRDFAALLMDSKRVQSYNKMSLGRTDVVVFQNGIDTQATTDEGGTSFSSLDGEVKIVRNVTKPPLSKKLMEFVTLMHARPLKDDDGVGKSILDDDNDVGIDEAMGNSDSASNGYIVVSRAVSGGRWSSSTRDSKDDGDASNEMTRSEILFGINLVRPLRGEPNKTEVTAVTHCNSPSVPTMLAGKVGIKGAIDFVKDVRALDR